MTTHEQWRGDQKALRDALDARRRQLADDLQVRVERIRENGSSATQAKEPDDGDPCDLDVALVEIAMATLRRIDQAIERLDTGCYGLCTLCQRPIGEARLRALPFAVSCQQCESLREARGESRRALRKSAWAREPDAGERSIHDL